MSQQIPEQPDPEIIKEAIELHKDQAAKWRHLWVATFLAYFLTISLGALTISEIRENNSKRDQQIHDLEEIATDIDAATGPEAQANQAEVIEYLVQRIDCSQRQAFQDALDYLVEVDILESRITIVKPECSND